MKSEAMRTHNNNIDETQIKELINQMACAPDDFKHLQIFLHRDRKINCQSKNEYLMVSPKCFGKVKISDLNLVDETLLITFYDYGAKGYGTVHININEKNPSTLFIAWNDIKSMVCSDVIEFMDNSGILEFDF